MTYATSNYGRYKVAKSITCALGYAAFGVDTSTASVASIDGTTFLSTLTRAESALGAVFGCKACGGNIKTCSIAGVATPSSATTVNLLTCNTGYYQSGAGACDGSCASTTPLPASWDS